jgi:hypothetical protein
LAEFFQAFTASVNNNPPVVSYAIDTVLSPSAVPSKAHDGVSFRVVRAVFLSFENGGRLINVTLCLLYATCNTRILQECRHQIMFSMKCEAFEQELTESERRAKDAMLLQVKHW